MGVSNSGESLRGFLRFMYCCMEISTFQNFHGNTYLTRFPFVGPYQTSCTGCGNVTLMGVSNSGESLRGFLRFMYCCMEISTFQNIHGNTYLTRFPFVGHTRPVVLVVGM